MKKIVTSTSQFSNFCHAKEKTNKKQRKHAGKIISESAKLVELVDWLYLDEKTYSSAIFRIVYRYLAYWKRNNG